MESLFTIGNGRLGIRGRHFCRSPLPNRISSSRDSYRSTNASPSDGNSAKRGTVARHSPKGIPKDIDFGPEVGSLPALAISPSRSESMASLS